MTPTPVQQRQYQELVEAIVKAVPDIVLEVYQGEDAPPAHEIRPITLEDVLMAVQSFMEKLGDSCMDISLSIDAMHCAYTVKHSIVDHWHPGKSLEWHRDNVPETISFLHPIVV